MPVYEYICKKCSHQFEREQRITEQQLKKCPKCGGSLTRLISETSFMLKGSGWYVTDYARKTETSGSDAVSGKNGKKAQDKLPPAKKEEPKKASA